MTLSKTATEIETSVLLKRTAIALDLALDLFRDLPSAGAFVALTSNMLAFQGARGIGRGFTCAEVTERHVAGLREIDRVRRDRHMAELPLDTYSSHNATRAMCGDKVRRLTDGRIGRVTTRSYAPTRVVVRWVGERGTDEVEESSVEVVAGEGV